MREDINELWEQVKHVGRIEHISDDGMMALGSVFGKMHSEIERLQKGEVYQILTIDDPHIVDFTFYTDKEDVSRRVSELNRMSKCTVFWYITLYSSFRNVGEDGEIGEN